MFLKQVTYNPKKVTIEAKDDCCTITIIPIRKDITIEYNNNKIFMNIFDIARIAIDPKTENINVLWIHKGSYNTCVDSDDNDKVYIEVYDAEDTCTLMYRINKNSNEIDITINARREINQQVETKLRFDITENVENKE